jgi:hypothetical protein
MSEQRLYGPEKPKALSMAEEGHRCDVLGGSRKEKRVRSYSPRHAIVDIAILYMSRVAIPVTY